MYIGIQKDLVSPSGQSYILFIYIILGGEIMFNTTPISSELCENYKDARIADILWHQQNQRGAALLPKQKLHLDSWITFPKLPNLIPFDISENLELCLDKENEIHLLLETNLIPDLDNNLVDQKIIKVIFSNFRIVRLYLIFYYNFSMASLLSIYI